MEKILVRIEKAHNEAQALVNSTRENWISLKDTEAKEALQRRATALNHRICVMLNDLDGLEAEIARAKHGN